MGKPWKIIESIPTQEGALELRRRDEHDYLITVGPRVLMNSLAHRSEVALGKVACEHLKASPAPTVLIGGLGMGYTLRAVLDSLPLDARVVVAELNPVVVKWCLGPIAHLTDGAAKDPRVTIEIANVKEVIGGWAKRKSERALDAVVLDLYEGPNSDCDEMDDPLYGRRAIRSARSALATGGSLAVWGENWDPGYEKRLSQEGFRVQCLRPGRGGLRHVVYLAALK